MRRGLASIGIRCIGFGEENDGLAPEPSHRGWGLFPWPLLTSLHIRSMIHLVGASRPERPPATRMSGIKNNGCKRKASDYPLLSGIGGRVTGLSGGRGCQDATRTGYGLPAQAGGPRDNQASIHITSYRRVSAGLSMEQPPAHRLNRRPGRGEWSRPFYIHMSTNK